MTKTTSDIVHEAIQADIEALEEMAGVNTNPEVVLSEFICERCGYHYKKATDFAPYLCYRCMRFIAKKVFVVMHTIQPPTSRTIVAEV